MITWKINKQIYVLNHFSPFPKAWNQSFDWILSGFSPLPTIECIIWLDIQWIWSFPNRSKHFCARVPLGQWAPARAQKCFDWLGNDQIHWISNQMMHSIVGKGKNPLSIQSNDWFQAFGKGEKAFSTYILLIFIFDFVFVLYLLYFTCLWIVLHCKLRG